MLNKLLALLFVFCTTICSTPASNLCLLGAGRSNVATATCVDPTFPTVGGAKLIYKANALALSEADAVGTWADGGSGAKDLTQGTAANKPTYRAAPTGFNNCAAVEFDGSNDKLNHATAVLSDAFGIANKTVYVVFRADSFSADDGSNPWVNPPLFQFDTRCGLTLSDAGAIAWNYDGTVTRIASGALSTGTTYLAILWHDGVNLKLGINGGALSSSASLLFDDAQTGFNVGVYSSNALDGHIAEIRTFDDAHDATELADMRTYFNTKYMIY